MCLGLDTLPVEVLIVCYLDLDLDDFPVEFRIGYVLDRETFLVKDNLFLCPRHGALFLLGLTLSF